MALFLLPSGAGLKGPLDHELATSHGSSKGHRWFQNPSLSAGCGRTQATGDLSEALLT